MQILKGKLAPDDRIHGLVREIDQECRRRGWHYVMTAVADENAILLFHPGLTESQQDLLHEEISPALIRFAENFASMKRRIM